MCFKERITLYLRVFKLCCIIIFLGVSCTSILAAPLSISEEEQKILEKSLSVVEINREISRIEGREKDLHASIETLSTQLVQKEEQITYHRQHASEVIRAYYMGERESLLEILLSAKSIGEFLNLLEYYELIAEQNNEKLNNYQTEYANLTKTQKKLDALSSELSDIKGKLIAQRNRILALQQSVDQDLSASSNPDRLKSMIEEMTVYWNNVGLYEVKRYFGALASAMGDFPEFLDQHKDNLVSGKDGYMLTIKEEELNDFIHGKKELLRNMNFKFDDSKITAQGSREGLNLRIEGHYTIQNKPQHAIVFHVDLISFNGLTLPDTTNKELEQEFDLGFYPKQIIPFIEATEVAITKGTMTIKLNIKI